MYQISIQHPEWGHLVCDYSTKSEALKRASYVRTHGCFFSDNESKEVLSNCLVVVYKNGNDEIYAQPFTQKYLSFRKES